MKQTLFILVILLIITVSCKTQSKKPRSGGIPPSLLGIDLGSHSVRSSIISLGSDILMAENPSSKRWTPNHIALLESGRLFGKSALLAKSKHNNLVHSANEHQPSLSNFTLPSGSQILGYPLSTDYSQVSANATDPFISVLELRSMFIHFLKSISGEQLAKKSGLPISNINTRPLSNYASAYSLPEVPIKSSIQKIKKVGPSEGILLVPLSTSFANKREYMESANLAGFKVFGITHNLAASALQLGLERGGKSSKDRIFPEEGELSLIVDIGASQTSAILVNFTEVQVPISQKVKKTHPVGKFEIISSASRNVGGFDFDKAIARVLTRQLKTVYKHKLTDQIRLKISNSAENIKHILSANQFHRVTIQSLVTILPDFKVFDDDTKSVLSPLGDFTTLINRDAFISQAKSHFDDITAVVTDVLHQSGYVSDSSGVFSGDNVSGINSVVLTGGSSRIPLIQDMIKTKLSRETIEQYLNAEESAAFGASLFAGSLSSTFRVRDFVFGDFSSDSPIYVDISPIGDHQNGDNDNDDEKVTKLSFQKIHTLAFKEHSAYGSSWKVKIPLPDQLVEYLHEISTDQSKNLKSAAPTLEFTIKLYTKDEIIDTFQVTLPRHKISRSHWAFTEKNDTLTTDNSVKSPEDPGFSAPFIGLTISLSKSTGFPIVSKANIIGTQFHEMPKPKLPKVSKTNTAKKTGGKTGSGSSFDENMDFDFGNWDGTGDIPPDVLDKLKRKMQKTTPNGDDGSDGDDGSEVPNTENTKDSIPDPQTESVPDVPVTKYRIKNQFFPLSVKSLTQSVLDVGDSSFLSKRIKYWNDLDNHLARIQDVQNMIETFAYQVVDIIESADDFDSEIIDELVSIAESSHELGLEIYSDVPSLAEYNKHFNFLVDTYSNLLSKYIGLFQASFEKENYKSTLSLANSRISEWRDISQNLSSPWKLIEESKTKAKQDEQSESSWSDSFAKIKSLFVSETPQLFYNVTLEDIQQLSSLIDSFESSLDVEYDWETRYTAFCQGNIMFSSIEEISNSWEIATKIREIDSLSSDLLDKPRITIEELFGPEDTDSSVGEPIQEPIGDVETPDPIFVDPISDEHQI